MNASQLTRHAHPHAVAYHAARVARAHLHPRWRPLALATLGRHLPPLDEQDPQGAHLPATIARWARSLAHVREPAAIGEAILPPWRTIALGAADCDDAAAAAAWLAGMVGIRSAVAVYRTGPLDAHMVAVVGPDSYARRYAHVIDHMRDGLGPWPPADHDFARTARLFYVHP